MIQFIVRNKSLLLLCLLACTLRIPFLSGSLWLDEAAQALESSRTFLQQTKIDEDYQPPLFHFIVHFFLLVSKTEWWIRLPSVIAGIGTIVLTYLLANEKVGKKVALISSLLLATSPFHIFFSQELRPYSLAAFFATLSWFVLLSDRVNKKKWLWFTVATTLGMYTMYLIPFNVLAQLIYIAKEKRSDLRSLILSLVVVALLFAPWLPSFLVQLQIGTKLTSQLPGWSQAVATPQMKVLPLTIAKFIVGQVPFREYKLILLFTSMTLAGAMYLILRVCTEKKIRVFLYWFLLPILLAWLVSFIVPVIQPKRVLAILPAFYLLIAYASIRNRIGTLVLSAVFFVQLLSFMLYLQTPSLQRENWRQVIASIESSESKPSTFLVAFPEPYAPMNWYADSSTRVVATEKIRVESVDQLTSVRSQLADVSTLYLFDYLRDLTDPNRSLETMLVEEGFEETGKIDAKAIGFVRIFARMK